MAQSPEMSIDRDFSEVVRELDDRFKGSGRQAELFFEKQFGTKKFFRREFFQQLFNARSAKEGLGTKIDFKHKLALIAAYRRPSKQNSATALAKLISGDGPHPAASDETFKGLDGFYRYWRYYPTVTHPDREEGARWGVIKLDTVDECYMNFSHWSHDEIQRRPLQGSGVPFPWDSFTNPNDTGFAFHVPARVFCLGFRSQNIRMVVINVPDVSLDKALFNGIMVTTRQRSRTVFAAGFVMVHQTNSLAMKDMKYEEFRREVGLTINPETLIIHS
jgi:hypothetical protein